MAERFKGAEVQAGKVWFEVTTSNGIEYVPADDFVLADEHGMVDFLVGGNIEVEKVNVLCVRRVA